MRQDCAYAKIRALRLRFGDLLLAALAGLAFLTVWWPGPVPAGGPEPVTVCLGEGISAVTLAVNGAYELRDAAGGRMVATLEPGRELTVRFADGLEPVLNDGSPLPRRFSGLLVSPSPAPRVLTAWGVGEVSAQGEFFGVNGAGEVLPLPAERRHVWTADGPGTWWAPSVPLVSVGTGEWQRRYRGEILLQATPEGIMVLNRLPLEEYLCGVVANEMPAWWPLEALKAQAVAARTYAVRRMQAPRVKTWDGTRLKVVFAMYADQRDQVYKGFDSEAPTTTRAVQETAGLVLTYRGRPITAAYHASSGGVTEDVADVWKTVGGDESRAYLVARQDPLDRLGPENPSRGPQADEGNPHYGWAVTMTAADLAARLTEKGYPFATVSGIEVVARTASGARVKSLRVDGTDEQGRPVSRTIGQLADEVRMLLGLKSAYFSVEPEYGADGKLVRVTFRGQGWGHGVGMSQWGALGLARKGYAFREILEYYYTDTVRLERYGP
ncbi:MAG: SpoIID/LytB domain-containing protein [Desulfotomaculales bacterium]